MIPRAYTFSFFQTYHFTPIDDERNYKLEYLEFKLTNIEAYFIAQMEDRYKVYCQSQLFLDKLHVLDSKILHLKCQVAYDQQQLHSIEKSRDRYYNLNVLPNQPMSADHATALQFFNVRHSECNHRIYTTRKEIATFQKLFYGILYTPLLECIKKIIVTYQNRNEKEEVVNRLKSQNKWDLSKILITIFKNSSVSIWEFDSFDKWDLSSIFSHPLIQGCEEILDYEITNEHFMAATKQLKNISLLLCVEKTLYYLDKAVLVAMVRNIISFVIKFKEKLTPQQQVIYNPNGIGRIIYKFLVGEKLVNHCIWTGILSNKRSRDVFEGLKLGDCPN